MRTAKVVFSGLIGVFGGMTTTALWEAKPHHAAIGFALLVIAMFIRVLMADYFGGE
jgi:uncharacterized membrane protein